VSVACTVTSTDGASDSGTTDIDNDSGTSDDSGSVTPSDAGDAAVCLDDTLPNADTADAGEDAGDGGVEGCAAFTNGCEFLCEQTNTNFKRGIAADINECLIGLPSCEGSDGIKECVAASAAKACDDDTVVAACEPLLTA